MRMGQGFVSWRLILNVSFLLLFLVSWFSIPDFATVISRVRRRNTRKTSQIFGFGDLSLNGVISKTECFLGVFFALLKRAKNTRLKGTCETLKHTSEWVAAESNWRMAAPGLKPLRLLRQSCQSFFSLATPSPHKHLIAISILAIKCLSWACRWASPRCPLKIVWPYTYTQITTLTPTTPISLEKSKWWPPA